MTKAYYRQILGVIKKCNGCGKHWRPPVYSKRLLNINRCENCIGAYYKRLYREYWKPYFAKLKPDQRERLNEQRKRAWINWVRKNPDKRRGQALASYHKNKGKAKNKRRKHRARKKKG